ncbi:MAG: polysaccharide pyruvyl transferase CsaB [Peptococcaceae bacterium]|nr:polysaccharide pyruvyl transferase CsaB [Peptococcaceae bacterium]
MSKTANIVMSGYYGFQNAGDDAVCYAIIEALRKEMPECKITVLSNDPVLTANAYGVAAENRWKWQAVWRALRQSDLLVSGGGSLIQDVTSKNSSLYYLGVILLGLLARKPVLVYGQGLGPLENKRNRLLTRLLFNRLRAIYVRDEDSLALLREIGVKQPIQVAPDPVLGIDGEVVDREKGLALLKNLGYDGERPLALLAIRQWPGFDAKAFASLGDHLASQGYAVGFLAMHHDQDTEVSLAVQKQMQHPAFVIKDAYDTPSLFSIFSVASLVVGMRLHSLIIGAALDKRVVGVSYDPKVTAFMKMIHNPYCIDITQLNAAALEAAVDECLSTERYEADHRMRSLKRMSRTPASHCRDILFTAGQS